MKRKVIVISSICIFLISITILMISILIEECEHSFDNNCDHICNLCEEERRVTHNWVDDSDSSKTCSICEITE